MEAQTKQQSSQLVSGRARIQTLQAESRARDLCCIKSLPDTGSFRRGTTGMVGTVTNSDWILLSSADNPPTSLRVQVQQATRPCMIPPCPHLLPVSTSLTQFQPHRVHCFSNTWDTVQPQGLCTVCSLHLKQFFKKSSRKTKHFCGLIAVWGRAVCEPTEGLVVNGKWNFLIGWLFIQSMIAAVHCFLLSATSGQLNLSSLGPLEFFHLFYHLSLYWDFF